MIFVIQWQCSLSLNSSVVSLEKGFEFQCIIYASHFERGNSVTSQPLASDLSSRRTGFDPGLFLTVTGLSLSTSPFPCQYHCTDDPYSSSSFLWFYFVSFYIGCRFCMLLFNFVNYVFLLLFFVLLCLRILMVMYVPF